MVSTIIIYPLGQQLSSGSDSVGLRVIQLKERDSAKQSWLKDDRTVSLTKECYIEFLICDPPYQK